MTIKDKRDWWKKAVFYHIYPHSFYDTNNDGIGDIEGIIQKLDYLVELGIDAIWLSPIYPSPMVDLGYDVSNYTDIHPYYGCMNNFKHLVSLVHEKGLKIILDLVLNHTSDQHPWFIESCSSKENPKRDWYIWESPRGGRKPNNWKTNFGKSAWTKNAATGEYYYHSFFEEQPDLNWRNPKLKEAMFGIIRFWLDLGVDGFRLDVINMLFKDKHLRRNPINFLFSKKKVFNRNRPSVYETLADFRKILDEYPDKTSVGEIYTPPPGDPYLTAKFLGDGNNMLHMAFDFSLIFTHWGATNYNEVLTNYYDALPKDGWPCFVLSNHDLGRSINRFLFERKKYQKAKLHALLLLTLKGTPFIYYGDEIGMENRSIPRKEIKDLYGKMFYPFYKGRDGARTPMQWDRSPNAGFSNTKPWLPVHPNFETINVASEEADDNSILNMYKKLIRLRKEIPVFESGEIRFLNHTEKNILSYAQFDDTEEIIVMLNFGSANKTIHIETATGTELLFSTHSKTKPTKKKGYIYLNPYEGIIIRRGCLFKKNI